jgi:hypothetical protein
MLSLRVDEKPVFCQCAQLGETINDVVASRPG